MMCSITAILVRNCGLGTTLFAELAPPAQESALPHGTPSNAGGLSTNTASHTGESRGAKNWLIRNAGFWPI